MEDRIPADTVAYDGEIVEVRLISGPNNEGKVVQAYRDCIVVTECGVFIEEGTMKACSVRKEGGKVILE